MSIPSTLKTISMADKMSVPQLQQAVKDGTIPAYIAVPLIQERMKDKQEAQAAVAGAQPQQPPVAQQVMAQADQQEALAALPTGMPQQYAHGGIVAFADGDLIEDDEDDTEEERQYMSALNMAQNVRDARINQTPATGLGYGDVQGQAPRAARIPESKSAFDASGHKYDQFATSYAEKIGLNPSLARYMLHKETGGLKNPESAVSKAGAMGPAQLMPATAKELGVDPRNPEQNVRGGLDYLKRMVDRYGDERLALAAYNAGPGNVDKALKSGKGIAGLPAETMRYVGMAGGGIVAFAGPDDQLVQDQSSPIGRWWESGSTSDISKDPEQAEAWKLKTQLGSQWRPYSNIGGLFRSQTPENRELAKKVVDVIDNPKTSLADLRRLNENPAQFFGSPTQPVQQTGGVTFPGANAALVRKTDNAIAQATPEAIKPPVAPKAAPVVEEGDKAAKPEVTPEAKPSDGYDFWSEYKQARGDLAKQGEMDKWLGLLNAGLGMMGGTSPNAIQNIGQGAMFGAQQYGQARKQTAAEQAALMKTGVAAKRYEELADIARSGQELTQEQKNAVLQQRRDEAQNKKIAGARDDLQAYEKMYTAKVQKQFPLITPDDPKYKQLMAGLYDDPQYKELWKLAYPNVTAPTGVGAGGATIRFDAKGNRI